MTPEKGDEKCDEKRGPRQTETHGCGGRDGGPDREFGWAFYNAATVGSWDESPSRCWVGGGVTMLRVYGTHLTTSELIANYRAAQAAVDV